MAFCSSKMTTKHVLRTCLGRSLLVSLFLKEPQICVSEATSCIFILEEHLVGHLLLYIGRPTAALPFDTKQVEKLHVLFYILFISV